MSRSLTLIAAATLALAACSHESTAPNPQDAATAVQTASTVLGAIPSTVGSVAAGIGIATVGPTMGMGPAPDASSSCSWNASGGYWVCAPVTHDGITVARQFAFYDANGTPQQRPDATTASMTSAMHVVGTLTTSTGTVTLDRSATNQVKGINTPRLTINGTESGTSKAAFTIATPSGPKQITTDEASTSVTKDLVVPAPPERGYPLSGAQSHSANVKATIDGVAQTHTSVVTITFDGTSTAHIELTLDGTTHHCTIDLAAHGAPVCVD